MKIILLFVAILFCIAYAKVKVNHVKPVFNGNPKPNNLVGPSETRLTTNSSLACYPSHTAQDANTIYINDQYNGICITNNHILYNAQEATTITNLKVHLSLLPYSCTSSPDAFSCPSVIQQSQCQVSVALYTTSISSLSTIALTIPNLPFTSPNQYCAGSGTGQYVITGPVDTLLAYQNYQIRDVSATETLEFDFQLCADSYVQQNLNGVLNLQQNAGVVLSVGYSCTSDLLGVPISGLGWATFSTGFYPPSK